MNQLTKYLVDGILNEGKTEVVAIYGGGFKPPTAGHFTVVEEALKQYPEIDKLIVLVGSGVRDGIEQAESILVWEIYQKYLPMKVEIQASTKPPVGAVYSYAKNNPEDTVYWVLGARDGNDEDLSDIAARTAAIDKKEDKYNNVEVKIITTSNSGMSGTNARKTLKSGNSEAFSQYLPQQLSDEEKDEVFSILKPAVRENRLQPYKFISSLKEGQNHITEYLFENSKGTKYVVNLINAPKTEVKVEYGAVKEGEKSWIKPTNEYEPLRIVSTVTEIIKDYFYNRNPLIEVVKWSATKGKNSSKVNSQRDKLNIRFFEREIPGIKVVHERKETRVLLPKMLTENASYGREIDVKAKIMELTQHMLDKGMNIEPLPKVEFVDGDSENARDFFGKTAYYDPNNQTIVLYTEGRHPKDIVRSFTHEMIHHIQNLEGRLGNITTTNTQEDDSLNDIEAEANLKGTMTFRNWTDSLQEKKKKDPFGLNQYARELAQGLEESLNEGRYDSISRQLASIALNSWKSDFKDGASYGYFTGEITPEEYPTDLTFTFKALGRFVDGNYTHNGYSRSDGEVGVKYEIPKDAIPQIWEEVYMDLISTIRHEIEHQTQSGKNVKPGKGMASDQELRKLISKGGSDLVAYVTLPKEIESNVQGLYLKAKKWRRPYDEIADEYIKDFLKITNPADVNYVKAKWQEVAKKRNLPNLLNEGRYDTLTNQLSKIAFEAFKDIHDRGDKKGNFEFRVDHPDDEHDIPSEDFYFDFVGKVEITDDEYSVDGGANAGFDNKGEEITPLLSVKFKIPKNPDWQKVSFDIKDVVRHELEHLTQDGENVKGGTDSDDPKLVRPSKQMEDDQLIRDLIDADMLSKSQYFKLEKEVDAMLQGLYFKAKKSKRPFKDVIDDYLNIFVDQETITPEEKEQVLDVWRNRRKALSLPLFENEKTVMNYEIYSDMDGVLTDFDTAFMKASDGIPPREYEKKFGKDKFWELIDGRGVGYWVGMPWMSDGKEYWDYIKEYKPILLSSPSRSSTSRLGKRLWVRNQLPGTKLILSQAKDKQNYAQKDRILIDDRPSNIDQWRSQGGVGILHTSASDTIRQLKDLGL